MVFNGLVNFVGEKYLSLSKVDLENEKKLEDNKFLGILICKCWCHENGSATALCIKCLTRIANGEESLTQ